MNTSTLETIRILEESQATAMEKETEKALDRGLRPKNVPLTDAEYEAIQPLNRNQRRAWLADKIVSMRDARRQGNPYPDLSGLAGEIHKKAKYAR